MTIGAVVLAAGRSQRMGSPKMILPWRNTTIIGQVVSVLLAANIDDIVVVTGGAHQVVKSALDGLPVRTAHNPDFSNGDMMLTFQVGLATFQSDVEATFVVLGDQPQIELIVVKSVIDAYFQNDSALIVPSYQRRRGHPWLLPRSFWADVMASNTEMTMRRFLDQNRLDIYYVNVNTPTVIQDIDTPEDYNRYIT